MLGDGAYSIVAHITNSRMVKVIDAARGKDCGLIITNYARVEGGLYASKLSEIELIESVCISNIGHF